MEINFFACGDDWQMLPCPCILTSQRTQGSQIGSVVEAQPGQVGLRPIENASHEIVQQFYKLSFTDDVYGELPQYLIAAAIIFVLTLAWWTTNIRDARPIRTVYLLDTRLRRTRQIRRLTHDVVSSTLVESTTESVSEASPNENEATAEANRPDSNLENKPPEATTSEDSGNGECASSSLQEEEQSRIVETMDADANEVRERRLAFFESRPADASQNVEACSADGFQANEVPTTSNFSQDPIMEHNYAERLDPERKLEGGSEEQDAQSSDDGPEDPRDSIRVKLKYINDDLKLVDGRLEEPLGDFKRRHFEVELSTNKLVKLIFNGKLLQRDSDSLKNYGFFDNCVVHCLIHQQRTSPGEETADNGTSQSTAGGAQRTNGRNNQRDWDLGNLLIILFSLVLSTAWYFRYQYPQFFTVTATVALVVITGVFTVVSIGMYFPDPDPVRPQTHIIR